MSEFGDSLPRGPLVKWLEYIHAVVEAQPGVAGVAREGVDHALREIARYTAQPPMPEGIRISRDMVTHQPPSLLALEQHRQAVVIALPSPHRYGHKIPGYPNETDRLCYDFTGTETLGTQGRGRWRYWEPFASPDAKYGWTDCDREHPGAPEPPVVI